MGPAPQGLVLPQPCEGIPVAVPPLQGGKLRDGEVPGEGQDPTPDGLGPLPLLAGPHQRPPWAGQAPGVQLPVEKLAWERSPAHPTARLGPMHI